MRRMLLALPILIFAGCDSNTPAIPTTAPPGVTTTSTTIPGDTCEMLAADMGEYLELVVTVLDDTSLADFRDRESWPEGLIALENQGRDFDARSDAMRCDLARLQEGAFFSANLDPDGPLSQYLFELFGRG